MLKEIVFARYGRGTLMEQYIARKLMGGGGTIVTTEYAKIASFITAKAQRAKAVSVLLEPIQDLHGYDKPWSGGNGANKWDEVTESGYINADGTEAASSTALRSKNYCPCVGGNTYYFCKPSSYTTTPNICWYDADKVFIERSTTSGFPLLTAPSNASFFRISMWNYGATYNHDIAINYPSTVTTYSPYSNICPISGRTECVTEVCGVNVFDKDAVKTSAGNFILDDSGQKVPDSTSSYFLENTRVIPNTTYYRVGNTSKGGLQRLYFFDADENLISRLYAGASDGTFTTPSNCYYLGYQYMREGLDVSKWSINYPSTDTEYHAYNGNTYTTALGRTVYGGTLDVVSGELVVDRASKSIPMPSGEYNSDIGALLFYSSLNLLTDAKAPINNNTPIDAIADTVEVKSASAINGGVYGIGVSASKDIYLKVSGLSSKADYVSAFPNGIQLVYELAEPITYQLTPTEVALLKGNNNLWSDGDVSVTYRA